MPRVLLLLATTTYRADDFLRAASELEIEVIVGSNERQTLADLLPDMSIELDFGDTQSSVERVRELDSRRPLDAIVSAEDDGALTAAAASALLGLPHNSERSVAAARYKHLMREALSAAGVRSPAYRTLSVEDDEVQASRAVEYPCVLKPVLLAASRGVIRADDEAEFARAFERIRRILGEQDVTARRDDAARFVLVEDFVPGAEIALEGLITDGELRLLAIFDKPEPLDGPYFEETYYITPSRHSAARQSEATRTVTATARALGLQHGPVHAELRINDAGVWVIEVAPRTIGGLCARTLRFGAGISLEELVLRHAVGMDTEDARREERAAGVLMLPIPRRGSLRAVTGIEAAEATAGIEGVTISIPLGHEVVPLPEGRRYLGFMFARGKTPEDVEAALREAYGLLEVVIE